MFAPPGGSAPLLQGILDPPLIIMTGPLQAWIQKLVVQHFILEV